MRKLCWFSLPCCAVILIACLGLPVAALIPLGVLLGLAGIFAGCLKRLPICLVCLGAALGLLWFQGYTLLFRAPADALAGQTTCFSATITDWPRQTSIGSVQVEVRLHLSGAADPKALLYTEEECLTLKPGDRIYGTASLYRSDIVRGEEVSYYEARGLYLRGRTSEITSLQQPDRVPFTVWPAYISRAIQNSVAAIFPDDVSGLMNALLTGNTTDISDSDYTALQHSGVSHIVSVSGLHLSFFAGFLALFFRRRSKLGAVLTLIPVFLFCAVVGFTPSVMRSAIMILFTLLSPLVGREEDPPTTLTAALLVLLLWNPYSALSVSLQLSFASVAGIHFAAGPLHRAMTRSLSSDGSLPLRLMRRVFRVFSANLSVTLGALLFTTPLTAFYFGSVSIISPVTNLLILWAVSLVFAPGLILTLLGIAIPGICSVLTFPFTLLLRYILHVTRVLGRTTFASLSMNNGYLCAWLVLVYLLIIALLLSRKKRPILPICAGAVTLCAALILSRLSVLSYPLSITMLDVGQGQSLLLSSGNRTALIDCGGNKDNAGDIAADYLNSLGLSKLDLLVLTHCHNDHANGVPELLDRIEVSNLILPDLQNDESAYRSEILALAETQNTEITLLEQNCSLSFGESTLTLYSPLGGGGTNEEGLFVLASCDDFDLLITGDANESVESLLVKYADLPDVEVLVAGHHGSKNSTSNTLLDATTPETCLISVGYNTYGHPADETLARLTERDISISRTDLSGHLTIRYKGD